MLYSMSEIRKLYNQAKYQRGHYYDFDIESIMADLRKDSFYDKFPDDQLIEYAIEKGLKESDTRTEEIIAGLKKDSRFKDFTQDQLYEYAYGIQLKKSISLHAAKMHSYLDHNRPNDPLWNQYTYEEILGMAEDGAVVPDEILSWAYSMQDSNSADYQIENNATDDLSTVENLDGETKTPSQSSTQKRSQAFSSKSDAQQELLESRVNETNIKSQNLADSQDELVSLQRKAIDEKESLMQEWRNLDAKAQAGTLSPAETTRYKEIAGLLAANNDDFSGQIERLNGELDELLSDLDDISVLIDINDKLGIELQNSSIQMADYEGSKKRGYLGSTTTSGTAGRSETMRAQAMGGDIAVNNAIKGTQLNSATNNIKNIFNVNINLTEQITEQLDFAKTLSQANPIDISFIKSDIPENEETENLTPDAEQIDAETADETDSLTPEEEIDETGEPSAITSEEPVVETEDLPAITPEEPTAQVESLASVKTGEPVVETVETTTDVTTSEPITEIEEPEVVAQEEPVSETEEPVADLTSETQDSAAQAIQSAVNSCKEQQSQMDIANSEIAALQQQVNAVRDNKFIDDMKLNVTLEANLKEYQQFAQKAQSGSELSQSDIARISQLEAFLDTDNGEYFTSLQGKLDILNTYGAAVENLNSLADSGKTYGQQAVEQGKAYAESEMGDTTEMKRKSNYILLSKEKRYDLLYGKSGESIGRDLIDSGESLISASMKTIAVQNNIINKTVSNFVAEYSENITGRLTGAAASVAPLKTIISTAVAQQAAKQADEQQNLNMQSEVNENSEQTDILINTTAVPEADISLETTETEEPENQSEQENALNSTTKQENTPETVTFDNEDDINNSPADEITQGEDNVNPPVEDDDETVSLNNTKEEEIVETSDSLQIFEEDDVEVVDIQTQPEPEPEVEPVDNDIVVEEDFGEEDFDSEYEDIVDEEVEPLPVNISEISSENDIQSVIIDEVYAESEENANMLNNFGAKLSFEKLAKEAAKTALDESMTKGGFHASGSANAAVSRAAGSDNKKSETNRTRRFLSYEDKNRRAALADRVENGKKVVMKRGKKKNS